MQTQTSNTGVEGFVMAAYRILATGDATPVTIEVDPPSQSQFRFEYKLMTVNIF